ncbi:hypothetical protein O3P69_016118 [Scylla paramamosain]|uniref:Ubiquitin-like domain-containing protein n=1 Tax=Scylla paramamosain TaxID=85552 RepID=A0AAW0SF42_SCYPA
MSFSFFLLHRVNKPAVSIGPLYERVKLAYLAREQEVNSHAGGKMQLFVRAENTHTLNVQDGQCIGDVRSFVCTAENLPQAEVRLYAAGTPLDNDALLLNTLQVDTIDVSVALKGGKVHGSLSRWKGEGTDPKS